MKSVLIMLLTLCCFHVKGQTKIFEGKIVDEFDLKPVPGAIIQNSDGVQLGNTDLDGHFKIELAAATNQLLLGMVGFEPTLVKLPSNCGRLEVIMMFDGHYDFMTLRRVNRKRYKRFKKLPEKHKQAYTKGTFTSDTPCIIYTFRKY